MKITTAIIVLAICFNTVKAQDTNSKDDFAGRHHLFVSASGGEQITMNWDGLLGIWFPTTTNFNCNVGYHFYNKTLLGCSIGFLGVCLAGATGQDNSALHPGVIKESSKDQNKNLLLKLDYSKNFAPAKHYSTYYSGHYAIHDYGGIPSHLNSDLYGLELGWLFYGRPKGRTFYDFTFGYQTGKNTIEFLPDSTNISSINYAVSGMKIDINFSFACSKNVHILWDMVGTNYIVNSTNYEINYKDKTTGIGAFSKSRDIDSKINFYMRLGLRYNFL